MIEVESLHCGYGNQEVLIGVSLLVKPGETVGVLGPNGSGKSTLFLALAGVLPIRSGSIRISGHQISGRDPLWIARRVASVPQNSQVAFPFKCLSLVLMGRYPHLDGWGGYAQHDMDVALKTMDDMRIVHLAPRSIREVSGGEGQMVTIARALAQDAEILLLDEATSNLDVARKIQVFDLLTAQARQDRTIMCVMHDLNLAALYCERLVFMKNGKIVAEGKTEEVFDARNLSEIYETEIRVSKHPVNGAPQAHFVPRGSLARGVTDCTKSGERCSG